MISDVNDLYNSVELQYSVVKLPNDFLQQIRFNKKQNRLYIDMDLFHEH